MGPGKSQPRALAPANIETNLPLAPTNARNTTRRQSSPNEPFQPAEEVAAAIDLMASEGGGPKQGAGAGDTFFSHFGATKDAEAKPLDNPVHRAVRKERRAKVEAYQAARATTHHPTVVREKGCQEGAAATPRGQQGHEADAPRLEQNHAQHEGLERRVGVATSRRRYLSRFPASLSRS